MVIAALPPAPILIHADEYTFNGSRNLGPSGLWRIDLSNIGEDSHDVWVLNRKTKKILGHSRAYLPGEHGTITIRLRPGTYTVRRTEPVVVVLPPDPALAPVIPLRTVATYRDDRVLHRVDTRL